MELNVSACRNDAKDCVCIFAVNMTKEPIKVKIDLSEYGASLAPVGGEMVCDTWDMAQVDIMNNFEIPDRIRTVGLAVAEDGITIPALSVAAIECQAR
jgi:uncharacterized protein with GYD domain